VFSGPSPKLVREANEVILLHREKVFPEALDILEGGGKQ
jgi:hypothetical protein